MEIVAQNKNDFKNVVLRIPDGTTIVKSSAFAKCNWINTVYIPEGVVQIEELAFKCCENLEMIHFPSTLLEIGACAFLGCSKLNNLQLKHVHTIGPKAFGSCLNLENVDMPHVAVIQDFAFYMCKNLDTVTNTDNVQKIGNEAFAHTGENVFIEFHEPLVYIGTGAFKYSGIHCVILYKSVNLQTLGIAAFQNCENLMGVGFAPKTKMKILPQKMFRNCHNLTEFDIPKGIVYVSPAAFENSAIQKVTFPDSLKHVARRAFHNCSQLRTPILSVKVTVDPSAFLGCRPTSAFEMSSTTIQMDVSDKMCSICLNSCEREDNICRFGCSHVFHTECAKGWYDKANTCANCRQEVKYVELVERPVKRRRIV
mgnify:FL=1